HHELERRNGNCKQRSQCLEGRPDSPIRRRASVGGRSAAPLCLCVPSWRHPARAEAPQPPQPRQEADRNAGHAPPHTTAAHDATHHEAMGGWVTSHNLETRSINEASGARGGFAVFAQLWLERECSPGEKTVSLRVSARPCPERARSPWP